MNFCVEVNHSIMAWYVGTWRVTGANRSKELEDDISYQGLVKLSVATVGREGPSLQFNKTGECYLLIDSKWGIFGREILRVHGSLHRHSLYLPGILGGQTLIKQNVSS